MGIELIITLVSAFGGFVMKSITQSRKERHAEHMRALDRFKAGESSRIAAAARGGVWVRRIIVVSVLALFIFLSVGGGLLDIPVVSESVKQGGSFLFGIFSSGDKVVYQEIHGFLLTAEVKQAFLALVAFYLGTGVAK